MFDLLSKRGKLPGTKFIFPLKIWLSIFVIFKLILFFFFFKTEKKQITIVNFLSPFVWTGFEIAIAVSIEKFLDDGLCI